MCGLHCPWKFLVFRQVADPVPENLVGKVLRPVDVITNGAELHWKPSNRVADLVGADNLIDAVHGVLLEGWESG